MWQPDSHLRMLIKGDYNKVNYGGFPNTPAYFGTAAAPTLNTNDPFNVTSNAPLSGRTSSAASRRTSATRSTAA